MKICPNCKQSNSDQSNFCSSCGMPISDVPSEEEKAPASSLPGGFSGLKPDIVSAPEEKAPKTADEKQLEELQQSGGLKVEYEPDDESDSDKEKKEGAEDSDSDDNSPKPAIIAVVLILSALVLLLGTIVVLQMINQSGSKEPTFNPPKIDTMEESQVTYFDSSYNDDWKNSRPSDEGEQEFEDLSSPQSEQPITSPDSQEDRISNEFESSDLEESQTYRAQYVMKVRGEPSMNADQVGRLSENEEVKIDEVSKQNDGSTWGRISGTSHWVCLNDGETTYLERVN